MAIEGAAQDGQATATVKRSPGCTRKHLRMLMLGALGVVYGDIGTSPIYAFREALVASSGGGVASRDDVLGVLSLIVWALTIIVTIKYVGFVLRADNKRRGRHAVADGAGAQQLIRARPAPSW